MDIDQLIQECCSQPEEGIQLLVEIGYEMVFQSKGQYYNEGLKCLFQADKCGNGEATYYIACLCYRGAVVIKGRTKQQAFMEMLQKSSDRGYAPATAYLYRIKHSQSSESHTFVYGPLRDFKGKKIRIDKAGIRFPIDAKLSYSAEEGNVLTLSADLNFVGFSLLNNEVKVIRAIIDGIKLWEGTYTVFGGQKLRVRMALTVGKNRYDRVTILALTDWALYYWSNVLNGWGKSRFEKVRKYSETIRQRRSFSLRFSRWTTTSRKRICMNMSDETFCNLDEVKHVAKHEFGHLLGLGDLYAEPEDGLEGVERGKYYEIDDYYFCFESPFLVMADHYGPVSNNDIEMVVLAFAKNKEQLYQKRRNRGKISEALGRGN